MTEYSDCTVCAGKSGSYLLRMAKIICWLLFHSTSRFDIVFIGFAPQLILPLFARKFKRQLVIIDFFISLYDTLAFDRKKISPHGIFGRFFKWADTLTLRHADWVIADTHAHGHYFHSAFGLSLAKLIVLYLEADTSIYYPRELAKRSPAFSVLYFGSILPLQGVETVLEAIELLQGERNLHFVLIGPLKKQERRHLCALGNTTLHHWLSQPDLAAQIAQSNLCLAGHFNCDIAKAQRTIPGKALIYQAMHKPMILGDCPANRELFSPGSGIYYVEQGDAKALAQRILDCKEALFTPF